MTALFRKAVRRAWRLRKRSHRRWHRRHSATPRFADKPLKRRERRAWDAIESGYYRTAPARSEPEGGAK